MLDKSFDKLSLIDDEGLSLEDTMGILRELVRESRKCACPPALSQPAQQRREGDQGAEAGVERDPQDGDRGP